MSCCTQSTHPWVNPTNLPANFLPHAATDQPMSQQTRLQYALVASLLTALPVLDVESAKILEHTQLRQHPHLKNMWDSSYANELGRLCQGVGEGTAGLDTQFVLLELFSGLSVQ